MLAKLRSLFHLSVATLFGLGGASAALLTGQEAPSDPPRDRRSDAEPGIVLAAAKTIEATDSLEKFLELYAGPPPAPVIVKPPPKVKKAIVKKHKHTVTKKVVKVKKKKAVTKRHLFRPPSARNGY